MYTILKKMKFGVIGIVVMSAFVLAPFAHALEGGLNAGVKIETEDQNEGTREKGGVDTSIKSQTQVQIQTGAKDESEIGDDNKNEMGTNDVTENEDGGDSKASISGNVTIIHRSELGDDKNKDAAVIVPGEVKTDDEARTAALGLLRANANVRDIELSDTAVSVSHKEHGKLFGFISVGIYAKATADAKGNTTIHYPWYKFLTKVSDADLKATLDARVKAIIALRASGDTSTKFTAKEKAQLANEIQTALKAYFEAQANATTSTSTQ